MMTGTASLFDRNVDSWLFYTESVKGRLLHELALHHLGPMLGSIGQPMKVLDAGCGLGDMAFPLVHSAEKLVLVDFSEKMIERAKERFTAKYPAAGPERIQFVVSSIEELESALPQDFFDLIICHNTLEYTEKPQAALASLAKRLAPGGLLSLVVANRFSEPFKLAFSKFDLAGARLALNTTHSTAVLFEHVRKVSFSFEELEALTCELGLKVEARRGIRIFSDYLPENMIEHESNFHALLALEKEAASLVPYIYAARYLQVICRKTLPSKEQG